MDFRTALDHYRKGQIAEAAAGCRQVLAANPRDATACNLLGVILQQQGDHRRCIELLRDAVSLEPRSPEFARNLAMALGASGSYEQAAKFFARSLQLEPQHVRTLDNLGVACEQLGRLDEAVAAYRSAIELSPDYAEAHCHLGNALRKQDRPEQAIASYQRAIELRPDYGDAHHGLAIALGDAGDMPEAIGYYRSAVALRPQSSSWHSDLLFALCHDSAYTARQQLDEARSWAARFAEPLVETPNAQATWSKRHPRRLRFGYVSPDFRAHTIPRLIAPVLAAHDRAEFEAICYASVARPDAVTERLQSLADGWRDISRLSDEQATELIRRDQVDVLVDLAGHMAGNRLLIFARRAAPVQVQLGYAATTGMSMMDYRITDAYCDPPGLTEWQYTEKLIRLPDCAWCYEPDWDAQPPGMLPASTNGYVTFACLNRPSKIADSAIACWSSILEAVQGSRLLVLASGEYSRLRARFARLGVGPERVTFVPRQRRRQYLESLRQADIALDTFPYNGDTTTCDALWMGVPVVTMAGDSFLSRRGVSHLSNVGLTDLIARDVEQYMRLGVDLAHDLSRLQLIRGELRERLTSSPLVDGVKYTRALEATYRAMRFQQDTA